MRTESKTNFANNLRPHMESGVGVLPMRQRKLRPVLPNSLSGCGHRFSSLQARRDFTAELSFPLKIPPLLDCLEEPRPQRAPEIWPLSRATLHLTTRHPKRCGHPVKSGVES